VSGEGLVIGASPRATDGGPQPDDQAREGSGGSAPSFPRQYARTRRLTLGEPRTITVSPDGRRVVFIRSRGGSDPIGCLWVLDVPDDDGEVTSGERLVADPLLLLAGDDGDLPPEERARRERAREQADGVVSYATNSAVTVAAFALSGRLFVAGLLSGAARELGVEGPVFDPRPDPVARRLAYVRGRTLRIAELDGTSRELAGEQDPDISWGTAEFVAAEEMDRTRGHWWAPDGSAIVAARVDTSPVARWWISDPAQPDRPPVEHAYPAAGTNNADVTLWVLGLDGGRREIWWDRGAFPYLVDVQWPEPDRIVLTVQSRDQRHLEVLAADPATGGTSILFEDRDDVWVELAPGAPAVLDDGRVVMTADHEGARRLVASSIPLTPPDLQVRSIEAVVGHSMLFTANPVDDATTIGLWRFSDGATTEPLVTDAGVHNGWGGGKTVVVRSATLDAERSVVRVLRGPELVNHAEVALVRPSVTLLRAGARAIATAVLLPNPPEDSGRQVEGLLPVLLDPYGGPHAQRVVAARNGYTTSQWFADQGFAVVIADGRGTPGRGSEWERAVHLDLAGPVLEDQVEALHAAAEQHPLDLSRVAIRGWSFGGYLAALAVLRRPDVFHAAIAGAPVTDWRLYDTHYTERYLGTPADQPEAYERTSLVAEVGRATDLLARPLLLVHGLADDNVVVAHTLQLSSALLAAGRPHRVLPLSGVTHMTPQEVVAENLLLLQLAFLRESLGISP
jgi:dipeptidyl-peptidase-4